MKNKTLENYIKDLSILWEFNQNWALDITSQENTDCDVMDENGTVVYEYLYTITFNEASGWGTQEVRNSKSYTKSSCAEPTIDESWRTRIQKYPVHYVNELSVLRLQIIHNGDNIIYDEDITHIIHPN